MPSWTLRWRAYLNGGLGVWSLRSLLLSPIAPTKPHGLPSSASAGLHTGLDVMHHLMGIPLCLSSQRLLGMAICDPIYAAWCFAGAPSVYELGHRSKRTTSGSGLGAE